MGSGPVVSGTSNEYVPTVNPHFYPYQPSGENTAFGNSQGAINKVFIIGGFDTNLYSF